MKKGATAAPAVEQQLREMNQALLLSAIRQQELAEQATIAETSLRQELATIRLLQEVSAQMLHEDDVDALYKEVVHAASVLMESDFASMQMLDEKRGELRMLAWRGFGDDFGTTFAWVAPGDATTCGIALRERHRVVASDIGTFEGIAGTPLCDVQLERGIRSSQSSPLVTRSGRFLGMLTTHWRDPHEPSERDLGWLDILARQATDLIERSLAEKALRTSEAQLRQIADSMPQIVWTARPDGEIDYFNERWYEFTGFERGRHGRESWEPILHPDDLQRCVESYYDCVREGRPYQIEYRFKDRKTGGYRWFMGRALPIRDEEGQIIRWLGTSTDIDDQKQVQEILRQSEERLEAQVQLRTTDLLASNEQLQGFTYSVAHDLRQQIRGISTNASMLLSDSVDALPTESVETLNRLVGGARRLADLVDDLLTYARLGRQQPTRLLFDLTTLTEEVAAFLIERGRCRPHTRFRIARDLLVQGDATLIRIVMENLLDNACKYSADRENPAIEVDRQGEAIFVRDNGIGFDMRFEAKLFQPFERLHGDSAYSGTGIGLANVKRIVEKHGGKVWAKGKPGEGASFFFTLG